MFIIPDGISPNWLTTSLEIQELVAPVSHSDDAFMVLLSLDLVRNEKKAMLDALLSRTLDRQQIVPADPLAQ